jgi:ABC-type lipoprotein release transport system permease subunit
VFFAVLLALVMRSMQEGSYDYMIDASVSMYTGYIQVHKDEYWDKRSIDKSMEVSEEVVKDLKAIENVTLITPRLESFSLISHETATKVASIIGIEPEQENRMTNLKEKLIKGNYLTEKSNGILLAEGLAELLKVDVGDSVVIYGQGFHGVTAADRVPIEGIVKFKLPDLNKMMDRITTLSIMINHIDNQQIVYDKVTDMFDENYEVMSWAEMMPELVQSIEIDNAGGIIMLGILYVIIGFGIFGTVMMMTAERTKEFGILISIGMKKGRLAFISFLESLFLTFIGVAAGVIISIPLLYYFYKNPIELTGEMAEMILSYGLEPILPFRFAPNIFIDQFLTVFVIAIISVSYPLLYIRRLKPVEAMRK